MSGQGDLLGMPEDADPREIIEGGDLGDVPEHKWAPLLADLLRVVEAYCKRRKMPDDQAWAVASELVVEISNYLGGRFTYLPRGDTLKTALLHADLWRRWKGNNLRELSDQSGYSEPHLYRILREQRRLHVRKLQGQLFDD